MTTYKDLLPPNSTPYERALAGPTGRILDVPVPIEDLWRWQTCPVTHLPWLAWTFSVDVWSWEWPEEIKRHVIKRAVELHRKKGTLYGIKEHLSIADIQTLKVVRPPLKAFAGRNITLEEHLKYLSRFPQLRLFKYRSRGVAHVRTQHPRSRCFAGYQMPRLSDAWRRTGTRAFYWDKGPSPLATGAETEITIRMIHEAERSYYLVTLPKSARLSKLFAGQILHNKAPTRDRPANRMYAFSLQPLLNDGAQRFLRVAAPSLEPIDLKVAPVAERGVAMAGTLFVGGILHGKTLPVSTAGLRLYDKLYIHDPRRGFEHRRGRAFAGHQRLGIKPYHAELTLGIYTKRPRTALFANSPVGRFPMTLNKSKLELAKQIVVSSKAARDKILIDTATMAQRTWGDGLPMDGSVTFEQPLSLLHQHF